MCWIEQILLWLSSHMRHTWRGQWPCHSRGRQASPGYTSFCSVPLECGLWKVGARLGQKWRHLKRALCPLARSRSTENREAALRHGKGVQRPGSTSKLTCVPGQPRPPLWSPGLLGETKEGVQTPRGHRPLLLCLELCPWYPELSLAYHWRTINVCWENESGNPGHRQQPRIPSRETSPGPCPPSTPAHLAPEWPLSQRGAAWWRQFGDGAQGGSTVGLEQLGCIFGKLQDVAGVCWLGVNGQDRACEGEWGSIYRG